jgi:hypothetical protein
MGNWQPIESAPRDGRWFIAYNVVTGPYGTCYRQGGFPYYGWGCGNGAWFPSPTHWQPFPEAPDERG